MTMVEEIAQFTLKAHKTLELLQQENDTLRQQVAQLTKQLAEKEKV
jgi:uncharacterized protein involved in exopolysaccharide biosynthesis